MLIGAMNHPTRDVLEEIRWMAEMGLEFVDLTLEPPAAASWRVDAKAIRRELDRTGLKVVGHTAYYLPIDSPFEEVRQGALSELKRCLKIFGEVGAKWMNIHPGRYTPMHPRSFFVQRDIDSFRELQETARESGVGLMVENIPHDFNTVEQLAELLDPLPEVGLHLDIGHSNLGVPHNTGCELIRTFGSRLRHVHFHDNNGHADQHLPLGTGNIDFMAHIEALKEIGYDETITLEVFAPDDHFLRYSRDVLRRLWTDQTVPLRLATLA
ncbi:MAG TPA: sugar phosphate isomerase/epimerase [Fimbriimonas sp.]